MIRNSWKVVVLKAWMEWFDTRHPCTKIDYTGGTLYIVRPDGSKINVDKARKRGKL